MAVYRVIQEALGNAARHGDPRRIEVRVERDGKTVVLDVIDDGGGASTASGGFGRRGMAERVEALGGHFRLTSIAGRGVEAHAMLPREPAPANLPA